MTKYAHLVTSHHFIPFVVETSGVLGEAALDLLGTLEVASARLLASLKAETSCRESR